MVYLVHRRDVAIRGWGGNWLREDPLIHPSEWLRSDLVTLAPFLQCEPHLFSLWILRILLGL